MLFVPNCGSKSRALKIHSLFYMFQLTMTAFGRNRLHQESMFLVTGVVAVSKCDHVCELFNVYNVKPVTCQIQV